MGPGAPDPACRSVEGTVRPGDEVGPATCDTGVEIEEECTTITYLDRSDHQGLSGNPSLFGTGHPVATPLMR